MDHRDKYETEMHETIRGLYQGIVEPDAWQRSLAALCRATDSAYGSLVVLDTIHDRFTVNQVVNPVPEAAAAYHRDFEPVDPAHRFTAELNAGDWYVDTRELGGHHAMYRLPFYGEFIRAYGMSSVAGCLVERRPDYDVFLALQRAAGRDSYLPHEVQGIDWAIPHLRQAIALREHAQACLAMSALSATLLDQFAFAVLVLLADGRLLMGNRQGKDWLRRLLPAAGRTTAWTLSRSFHEMLQAACDPAAPIPARGARARAADGCEASVVVVPLPPQHRLAQDWQQPAALVMVHEVKEVPPLLGSLLRDLYGLTPAEIRLATALAGGAGLPEACARLGIHRETSRSQLKSIFQKTGTGTQARLAHLLTQLGAALVDA
ncbi:LuxR family transcriptional regulator [Cupriavidus sp. USMAHM13]|uniref:helix-turn-helix transcriptional regulator n=1 Tax=Cupriavidus sp. USMAHM13 TaxID=1389192 RepID=UPI0008A703B2|nr:helix-turn-helix transcriptional regulator [Cupriavidus sp. USMAHM13]AOY98787.1 LuxR family transcriptional regulator [Cupriavidus sp. USMAHM13]